MSFVRRKPKTPFGIVLAGSYKGKSSCDRPTVLISRVEIKITLPQNEIVIIFNSNRVEFGLYCFLIFFIRGVVGEIFVEEFYLLCSGEVLCSIVVENIKNIVTTMKVIVLK